ncbi:MAG: PAS domain-containing sensor histidine kinase [Polyangiaceae bacterium]
MAEARFRLMADCSPVLLWMAGTDARCDFFNQTWLAFRGRTLEQEVGYGWAEGIHPEDFEGCMNTYTAEFSARRAFEMEYRLQRADGAYRWILDRGAPRFEADGSFAGYIGSCVDITELKEARERAERDARSIAIVNQQIERFLFATSHDLREPVRMVLSYSDLLQDEGHAVLSKRGQEFLGFVREGAVRLTHMVQGLNDFMAVRHTRVDMRDVTARAVLELALHDVRLALEESSAKLEQRGLGLALRADPPQLARVLQNLLLNAIRYAGDAPPRIVVEARTHNERALLTVSDSGIGFAPEHAARIFEMFQRLVSRDHAGSGVGLAVCREIVELHGGKIWATSEPGKGAVFHISLPLAAAQPAHQ